MASPDSDMDLDSLLSMQSELEYLLQSDSHHFLSQEPPAEPSEEAQPPQPPQPQLRPSLESELEFLKSNFHDFLSQEPPAEPSEEPQPPQPQLQLQPSPPQPPPQPPPQRKPMDVATFVHGSGACALGLLEDSFLLRTPNGADAVKWWLKLFEAWALAESGGGQRVKQFMDRWAETMGPFLQVLMKQYEKLYDGAPSIAICLSAIPVPA